MEYQTRVTDEKRASVEELKNLFASSNDYIFTDYRGLSVEQMRDLRAKLRGIGASYKVVKNRYARIAFQQLDAPETVGELLKGPTAVALVSDGANTVAKELLGLGRDWALKVKGALVGGGVLNDAQTLAFSRLPGRDQLIAMLMSTMQAPLQNFVYTTNGITTKLVRVLQAVADKKGEA